MSGSAGGGGYEYQASAIAYVGAHILAERRLSWLSNLGAPDIPDTVLTETGGPGDDLRIILRNGSAIEVQAKHGLTKGAKYWKALLSLARGLAADPRLYGILLVDSTASGTIRNELRGGLLKLANASGGTVNSTTREVVKRFADEGIDHPTLFERLAVMVVDVEEGLPGMQLACEMLARVVVESNQARTAWEVLERDGLRLIRLRGERNTVALAGILEAHPSIKLSSTASNVVVIATRHAGWLRKITSSFTIPGLGLILPIETAWIDLDLAKIEAAASGILPSNLEEQLVAYHNQHGLGRRQHGSSTFKSRYLLLLSNRIVLVGGPGVGKSTLLRHIAHDLSSSGYRVLYVRLPQVFKALGNLGTFQNALLTVATDNTGISLSEAQRALGTPDFLLADGLDECERREAAVQEINAWAEGHPTATTLIATRSFGHRPILLPNWTHVDVLPLDLDNDGLRVHARRLMSACGLEAPLIEEKIDELKQHLHDHGAVSVAARNPLLFGFLVGLSILNVPLGRTRAELYERVVQQAYQRAERDRDDFIAVEESIASYILDAAAWHLMHEPSLPTSSLLDILSEGLARAMDYSALHARTKAERVLAFWQQQGIIETLRWSGEEIITFIHPTLGEYAAARYVGKNLDRGEINDWIAEVRRDQRWRQTILLATGTGAMERIVSALFTLDEDDGELSVATEAVLAAAALTEVAVPPSVLVEAVIGRLRQRLVSRIPAVAFEAATAILGLASCASPLIAQVVRPLLSHDQRWTRLAATRLALAVGTDAVDVEALATIVADILNNPDRGGNVLDLDYQRRWQGGGEWEFQNAVLIDGLDVLIRRQPGSSTNALLARAVGSNATSAGTEMALLGLLQRHGYNGLVNSMQERWGKIDRTSFPSRHDYDAYERAILDAVAHAAPPPEAPSSVHSVQDLESLAILLGALGWLGDVDGGWLMRPEYDDQAATDVVIGGSIAALRLDPKQLSEEVEWAQVHLAELRQNGGLLASLDAPPVTPQWQLAVGLNLPLETLSRSLMHPSRAIYQAAAQLLYQHADDPLADSLLKQVLDKGGGQSLAMVAALAPHVWKEDARDVIVARLDDRLTSGCVYLVPMLTRLAASKDDVSTPRVLLRCLNTEDPRLATAAANALTTLDPNGLLSIVSSIEQSLHDWTIRGTKCSMHGVTVYGDTHDRCLLVVTSPRAALVTLLARVGHLDNESLIGLCGDQRSDVRKAAAHALTERAQDNVKDAVSLLVGIQEDALPIEVLEELLASSAVNLDTVRQILIDLFHASNTALRRRMVEALPEATWLDKDQKLALATDAALDEDASVRDHGADALRAFQSSTS